MIKIGNASVADTVRFHVHETADCIIEDGVQLRDNVVIDYVEPDQAFCWNHDGSRRN
jgi:hypothetical protein